MRPPAGTPPRGSTSEILVGVSACLLGEEVRFDGGHKRNAFLTETLAPHVRFVPVCPEVGIGLGVPRPALRLVERDGRTRLLGPGAVDHTGAVRRWAQAVLTNLSALELSGFVLKKSSPTVSYTHLTLPTNREV